MFLLRIRGKIILSGLLIFSTCGACRGQLSSSSGEMTNFQELLGGVQDNPGVQDVTPSASYSKSLNYTDDFDNLTESCSIYDSAAVASTDASLRDSFKTIFHSFVVG